MAQVIKELQSSYDRMMTNFNHISDKSDMSAKIQLINQMIIDVNNVIDEVNFAVLENIVELTELEKKEYDDMVMARNTIKALSPYIIWFNTYQQKILDGSS
jgi:hypothetical protein